MPNFVIEPKKKKEYEQFTCRIEVELLEKARKIVLENNLPSVNEFINLCMRFSIDNLSVISLGTTFLTHTSNPVVELTCQGDVSVDN